MFSWKNRSDDDEDTITLEWVRELKHGPRPVPAPVPAPAPVQPATILEPSMVRSRWVVRTLSALAGEIARQIIIEMEIRRYYAAADLCMAAYLAGRGWNSATY